MSNRRSQRPSFQASQAPRIANEIGLRSPWTSTSRISDYFAYFGDDDVLAVVAGPDEEPLDIDKALAYGLSYSGDRDLWLVLPTGTSWPTLARAAFLEVPIRVFEHGGEEAWVLPRRGRSCPGTGQRGARPRGGAEGDDGDGEA